MIPMGDQWCDSIKWQERTSMAEGSILIDVEEWEQA